MRSTYIAAVFIAFLAAPALAQTAPAGTTMRVVGTVDKLDGNNLTVNMKDGPAVTVVLADNAAVFGVEKRTLADIKPGDYLASGGVKGTDGKIHAVEVRIFPETLRGTGEGQRPWDVKPDGVMTNATVGTVTQSPAGGVIHVKYKEGESEYTVGPEVPIVGLCRRRSQPAQARRRGIHGRAEETRRYADNRPGDCREERCQAADVDR